MASHAERYADSRRRQALADSRLAAFALLYPFGLDPFQVRACEALEAGSGVLVAAPTGAGKTVVGEFAVHLALAEGRKCFYTTPIKALSNQKYADLVARHGSDKVGLLTGDNSVNGDAAVVVMTTEVLRNMLYAGSATLTGLGYVVMDEVHYLSDRFRGAVWEEVIIHLPESVALVSLSATVSNAEEFGDWLGTVRGQTEVVVEEHRPVPLWQHVMANGRLWDLFVAEDAGGRARVNPELARLSRDQDRFARSAAQRPARGGQRPRSVRPPSRVEVLQRLDSDGLLPAITFIFSRAGCDAAVRQCLQSGLRLLTPQERIQVRDLVESRCADIPEEDRHVLGYHEWLEGLERGIAAHHAGMLPTFKEVVEQLFVRGLVKAVFATETLALGINMPARSVVLERLVKFNGETHADITPGEYTQLTGRAGRRGIDIEGHAVVLWQPGLEPAALGGLASTRTYPLRSSFRPSYNMAVNLVGQFGRVRARTLLESSFAQFQADRAVVGLARQVARNTKALIGYREAMTCHLGDFEDYAGLRRSLSDREAALSRNGAANRRAQAAASLEALRPGDVIMVPAGRRGGLAVVLDPDVPRGSKEGRTRGSGDSPRGGSGGDSPRGGSGGDSPRGGSGGDSPRSGSGNDGLRARSGSEGPRPTVLTSERQVRRLSLADFPGPVEALHRLRIPKTFNPRNPANRRDLAATLRGTGLDELPPSRTRRDRSSAGDDAELTQLRAALRAHPCHGCAEREDHARWAERFHRLSRETEDLSRRVRERTHLIARTFDRICELLQELGYLRGDAVTTAGQALGVLYSELDLLAAECLRDGVWAGLTPAELSAAVSPLVYESRRDDDPTPVRLPPGRVREVLAETERRWSALEGRERAHRLTPARSPDPRFCWATWRWASGEPLEAVLRDVDLAPGDFVRWTKQVIDLLGQVADAGRRQPGAEDVGLTARAAADLLRRGVVAYSSVA